MVPVVDLRKIFRQVGLVLWTPPCCHDRNKTWFHDQSGLLHMHVSVLCSPQAEASTIVTTAHQINSGLVPTMEPITAEQLPVRCTSVHNDDDVAAGLVCCNARLCTSTRHAAVRTVTVI